MQLQDGRYPNLKQEGFQLLKTPFQSNPIQETAQIASINSAKVRFLSKYELPPRDFTLQTLIIGSMETETTSFGENLECNFWRNFSEIWRESKRGIAGGFEFDGSRRENESHSHCAFLSPRRLC